MPLTGSTDDAVYAQNIQTAELNALNAVLAITRWKRARGFYTDLEHEVSSTYIIDGNAITNTLPAVAPTAWDPADAGLESAEGIDREAADDSGGSATRSVRGCASRAR